MKHVRFLYSFLIAELKGTTPVNIRELFHLKVIVVVQSRRCCARVVGVCVCVMYDL